MTPILLPVVQPWAGPEDVALYAESCLEVTGLEEWSFGWDRTIRRMGCCKPGKRSISLSVFYVQKYWALDPEQVRRTILHELAHALAWEFNHTLGHDATWHRFCVKLGIAEERCRTACESFTPEYKKRTPRFVLYHKETGEVFHYYTTTPRSAIRKISTMYIRGRQNDTLGKLAIRPFDAETDRPE